MDVKSQSRLLLLAALFIGLYALGLSISPAVIHRSWDVDYSWGHWLAVGVWSAGFGYLYWLLRRRMPDSDVFLLAVVGLLSGWGVLTIWRLSPSFGIRQTIWLGVCFILVSAGMQVRQLYFWLRRYKYVWLVVGTLLLLSTLVFGTNPMGYGPRLWLGCCGVYFQPSEPLKLLLVIYLAAYLADRQAMIEALQRAWEENPPTLSQRLGKSMPLLIPTILMSGIAIALLLVQRDLGTAAIFVGLYAVILYLGTGWLWVPLVNLAGLVATGFMGYYLFDVVRLRIDAWINPWLDPSGRSYQIIQSLMAVANGGVLGRGPGLGYPEVVPIAHSDFILSAIAEETGLAGVLGLVLLLAFFLHRGLRLAFHAVDPFQRFLAGGLTTYVVAQSILIMGGNIRLLPLTGVTLPYVSYGGSSLLVSFVAWLLLARMPSGTRRQSDEMTGQAVLLNRLGSILLLGLLALAAINGWWSIVRSGDLLSRTDNPRRAIAEQYVPRGAILDRNENVLVETVGTVEAYHRKSYYALGAVLGYNHPVYGQAGLEASFDPYLRGVAGYPPDVIWWNHILYGHPPEGLDLRLTLDITLQALAQSLFGAEKGALVMINAANGEIYAITSQPSFDPTRLDEQWEMLMEDDDSPLFNRAVQGEYPAFGLMEVLPLDDVIENTAAWDDALRLLGGKTFQVDDGVTNPLYAALAAAVLTNEGVQPSPKIALSVRPPGGAWQTLPPPGRPVTLSGGDSAFRLANPRLIHETNFWYLVSQVAGNSYTWFVGGTQPTYQGVPIVLALVIETGNEALAQEIGLTMMQHALLP